MLQPAMNTTTRHQGLCLLALTGCSELCRGPRQTTRAKGRRWGQLVLLKGTCCSWEWRQVQLTLLVASQLSSYNTCCGSMPSNTTPHAVVLCWYLMCNHAAAYITCTSCCKM